MEKNNGDSAVNYYYSGLFIPVPYYISKPGGTEELAPLVTVDNHPNKKDGSLSLVTIAMGKANIYTYMTAKFCHTMS